MRLQHEALTRILSAIRGHTYGKYQNGTPLSTPQTQPSSAFAHPSYKPYWLLTMPCPEEVFYIYAAEPLYLSHFQQHWDHEPQDISFTHLTVEALLEVRKERPQGFGGVPSDPGRMLRRRAEPGAPCLVGVL